MRPTDCRSSGARDTGRGDRNGVPPPGAREMSGSFCQAWPNEPNLAERTQKCPRLACLARDHRCARGSIARRVECAKRRMLQAMAAGADVEGGNPPLRISAGSTRPMIAHQHAVIAEFSLVGFVRPKWRPRPPEVPSSHGIDRPAIGRLPSTRGHSSTIVHWLRSAKMAAGVAAPAQKSIKDGAAHGPPGGTG